MAEPLTPEQVDEIRRRWAPGPDHALTPAYVMEDVLALCDTVESLRAENERLHHAMHHELHRENAELETLRGIAKRNADGWDARRRPDLVTAPYWISMAAMVEPMTPVEVHAIYGKRDVG